MSHFTVLVIGPEPEVQLSPFQEPERGGRGPDYNPKWDWYELGGRWTGYFKLRPGATGDLGSPGLLTEKAASGTADQCRWGNVDVEATIKHRGGSLAPFAIVKNGRWYENGRMGWWGGVSDAMSDEEWKAKVAEILGELPPDTLVSLFDCHI